MSAFIGPIHHWLFAKIRFVSQREELIYQKALSICDATAEELREQAWQTYGEPLPDADLASLIDHGNIHGWLQRQINLAESREAAFIKELLDTCGQTAADLIAEAFQEHGRMAGTDAAAKGSYDLAAAPGIYKALNDYYLNGMPCDQGDMVVTAEADRIVWETAACLQEPNWKRVGVDSKTMAQFYQSWLKEFVAAANPAFAFQGPAAPAGRFEIRREQ